jgi:hypothetical protein
VREVQIGAPTDAATGAVKLSAGQKRYLVHYIYRSRWSARHKLHASTTTYFYSPNILELLLEVNMASRAKHGWSALQSAFTASKFSASAEDALKIVSSLGEERG